jgi:glycosyltransferase involved in cell wall biosynthesis
MERPRVLILGKLPPPLIGPALATQIILNSSLKEQYELKHFDTALNKSVSEFGKVRIGKIADIQGKYRAYRKLLKEFKPDLVLIPIGQTSAGFFKDVPFIRLAALSRAKILLHLRGSAFRDWYNGLDVFRKKVVAKSISRADGAIVLGENLSGQFSHFFNKENIHVVPNGADYSFPERKSSQTQVTYIANYLPGKGIREVLLALQRLKDLDSIPPFRFKAFGAWDNDDYKKECENIAVDLPHVELNDSISGNQKWQELSNSDLFIFTPNHPEGHPWSIVEATAAGLPIISTDRGAISQSVRNNENGFLLDNPEPEIIAEKLHLLLSNSDLRKKMGKASRELYLEKFTAQSMVKLLDQSFKTTLDLCVESSE